MRRRVVVIGAGIVGVSVARWLTRFEGLEVVVVDKEPDVGWGVTKANTSIIHPCHEEDPDRWPVRARLCVRGHRLWYDWVRELDIPSRWPGEVIVARTEEELGRISKYVDVARRLGVPGVRFVDREELIEVEPAVNPDNVGGLLARTAGLISPMKAAIAIAENAAANGARFLLGARVRDIIVEGGAVRGVVTDRGVLEADVVVNAAGVWADEVAEMAGVRDYRIRPRRGQYAVFSDKVGPKPRLILHTAPTPKTKGVYAVTTVDGNLMVGPTAEDLPDDAREAREVTGEGIDFVLEQAAKILKSLPPRRRIIRTFAGIRPEPTGGDFIIRFHEEPWGFVEAAGIRSPGLTAAPAIGEEVARLVREALGGLVERDDWVAVREGIPHPATMARQERDALIRAVPEYGRIICACRKVSEGEVIEAVERARALGAGLTLDGIKFRVGAMYGDCQGSQCRAHIAYLIWRRYGVPPWELMLNREGSRYALAPIKALLRGGRDE